MKRQVEIPQAPDDRVEVPLTSEARLDPVSLVWRTRMLGYIFRVSLNAKKKQFILVKYNEEKRTGELDFHNRTSALETVRDWCPIPACPRSAANIPIVHIIILSPKRC
jgi:hypothetical protein